MKGSRRLILGGILFASMVLASCMNAPLPPESASLTATILREDSTDHEGTEVLLPGTSYRGITDRQGKIIFDNLPPRKYEIVARSEKYIEYRESDIRLESGDHIDLGEIRLSPKPTTGTISGKVAVPGVSSATVEVVLLGSDLVTLSKPDGSFQFEAVPPGKYGIDFDYPGHAAENPLDVTVEAGTRVTVQTLSLRPLPEPAILHIPADWSVAESVEAATATVSPATSPARPAIPVPEPQPPLAGPLSDAPAIVRGFAYYPDKTTHEGIQVRLVDPPRLVQTDASGAFLIPDVPPGLRSFRAESEGYLALDLTDLEVKPADVTTTPKMTLLFDPSASQLSGSTRIYGQVVLQDLGPQPGVLVTLEGSGTSTATGLDGSFILNQVIPGTYSLTCFREGYQPFNTMVQAPGPGDYPVPVVTLVPEREYMKVMTTIPARGERKVEVSDRVHIQVRFDRQIQPRTARPSVSVFPPAAMRVGAEDEVLYIDLLRTQPPIVEFETEYTVAISTALQSIGGETLEEPYELTFRTGGPRILGTFPETGARDVILPPDQPIIIEFNSPVDLRDLAEKIKVNPDTGEVPNLRQQRMSFGQKVEVQLPVAPNRRYRITIPSSLRTADGNNRYDNTPYRIEFRTGDYDALPDRNDEYLQEIDGFLDY